MTVMWSRDDDGGESPRRRVTRELVRDRAERVSARLPDGRSVHVEGRYGYVALDLYYDEAAVRTLTAGTARQVHVYLEAMSETLALMGR